MAAPKGNNNASKARIIRDQMQWALDNFSNSKVQQGQALRQICTNLVQDAVEEKDKPSIGIIFDRLEGKAAQALQVSGQIGISEMPTDQLLELFNQMRDAT